MSSPEATAPRKGGPFDNGLGPPAPPPPPQKASGKGGWREVVIKYRLFEFGMSGVAFAMMGAMVLMPTHMRTIPRVEVRVSSKLTVYSRDPLLDNKKMPEQVPMIALMIGCTFIPIFANLCINYVLPQFKRIRSIPHDTRDFLLSVSQSAAISQVITHFLKNMTGRFRPCFYDMCKWDHSQIWDGVTSLCQDKKWELEGRRSFPSGHASYAWATLFLTTLYLLGRSRLNVDNRADDIYRGGRKSLKLFICFLPTLLACWIAVTRSIDNWHHYADILAGSVIGALAAVIGYGYNYSSIFNAESAGVPHEEMHVRLKKKDRDLQASLTLLANSTNATDYSRGEDSYAVARSPSRKNHPEGMAHVV